MSDTPNTTPRPSEAGDEYGFNPNANPLSANEAQRDASKYGIYGHQAASGEAYEGEEGQSHSAAPDEPAPPEPGLPSTTLPQPTEFPQRDVTTDDPATSEH